MHSKCLSTLLCTPGVTFQKQAIQASKAARRRNTQLRAPMCHKRHYSVFGLPASFSMARLPLFTPPPALTPSSRKIQRDAHDLRGSNVQAHNCKTKRTAMDNPQTPPPALRPSHCPAMTSNDRVLWETTQQGEASSEHSPPLGLCARDKTSRCC